MTNTPYKNKHHPESDESNWHLVLWWISQLAFAISLVAAWQSPHTCRFLKMCRVVGGVLMTPNAKASFALCWNKWKTFSSSSTSCSSVSGIGFVSHVPKSGHSNRQHYGQASHWTPSKRPQCSHIWHVHVNKATTCKNIRERTALRNLFLDLEAFFKCHYTSTCI